MKSANVDEQVLYQAAAGWLESAVDILQGAGVEVIAPVETDPGVVELAAVKSSDAVVTDYANARLPLKQVFFPISEVLLEFDKQPDNDLDVDIFDYSNLLSQFGQTGSGLSADFDQDNDVDIFDYSTLLSHFGS